ncbi:recombinase family protein [Leptospira interrogans]
MPKPRPRLKAYSYLRFSTPEQMRGDSLRRQTELAQQYAATHGLDLDQKLTFRDLGVSAFRGRNIGVGKLGIFLEAVEDGLVEQGSYLLVESLDRISRLTARRALRVLEEIVDAGVNVVTLVDGRVFTKENLDEDPVTLLMSILTFIRANEESATKARRLRAVWQQKRRTASDKPMTSRAPAWLELRDGKFVVLKDRAKVIRMIFDLALKGNGQHKIADILNDKGILTFSPKTEAWGRSYVKKILENPAAVGTFIPHETEHSEDGRKARKPLEPVQGYYPAVIDAERFERVQAMRAGGTRTPVDRSGHQIANALAGLARCPKCGSTMTRVSKGPSGGRPRLVCTKAKRKAGCGYKQVILENVEETIRDNIGQLIATAPSPDESLEDHWQKVSTDIEGTEEGISNILEEIARGNSSPALSRKLRKLEDELAALQARQADLSQRIGAATSGVLKRKWEELEQAWTDKRPPAEINALMRQSFNSVVVDYPAGLLRFFWKHGGESEVVYAWPTDEA